MLFNDELLINTSQSKQTDFRLPCLRSINIVQAKKECIQILKLAWPTVISQVFTFGLSTQSVIFAGHLGELELATVSLASSFINVTGYSVAVGLCTALETLCSQAYGAKKYGMVGTYLQRGICILSVAMLLTYSFWMQTEHFLLGIGVEQQISRMTDKYIMMSLPILPGIFGQTLLQRYLQVQGIMQPVLYIGMVVFCCAIGINYLLVLTLHLGISGIAISFYVNYYLFSVLLLVYIYIRKIHHLTWKGWSFSCLDDWRQFIGLAVPGMMMICVEWWSFEIGSFLLGRIDDSNVAAHGILFQLATISFMLPIGTGLAATVSVGMALGSNQPDRAKLVTKVSLIITIAFSALVAICVVCARKYIVLAFTDDREVINLTIQTLPIVGTFLVFDASQGVMAGIIRGSGRQKIGLVLNVITYFIIALPLGITLTFIAHLDLLGFWCGLAVGLATQVTLYGTLLYRTNWQRQADLAAKRTATHRDAVTNGDCQSHQFVDGESDFSHSQNLEEQSESLNDISMDTPDEQLIEVSGKIFLPRKLKIRLLMRRSLPLVLALAVLMSSVAVRICAPVNGQGMARNSTMTLPGTGNVTNIPT
ncbi:multidrug and toxin extrusion protein 2 isoform X2 [Nematostella vectensis]|nr:multidrug and toxin extrusion protein 2 isoform X2 [Nematostella vectensis]